MATLFVDKIDPQSGTSLEIGSSGDTLNLGATSGGTLTNRPSFKVMLSSGQDFSNETWTKIQVNTEVWDTDNAFDTSNYKFVVPTGKAGKYRFSFGGYMGSAVDNKIMAFRLYINDNADNTTYTQETLAGTSGAIPVSACVLNLSVGDEVCVYFYQNMGGTRSLSSSYMHFEGERLIS
jgi:hypothetical protein